MMSIRPLVFVFVIVMFVGGCASTETTPAPGNSFLSDYSRLKQQPSEAGVRFWRWRSPDFFGAGYDGIKVAKLVFDPQPEAQDQVSAEALEDIRHSAQQILEQKLDAPGSKNALVLRSAITSVSLITKAMSVREVIPIRLVFSGAELLMGKRDKNFSVRFEYELVDPETGKVMFAGVRESIGKPIVNSSDQLSDDHARPIFDRLLEDLQTLAPRLMALISED